MKLDYFSYAIAKQNLQLRILLRNNLTLRLRSICVSNALHLRSERVPFAFQTRSKMRSKAFQCIPAKKCFKDIHAIFEREVYLSRFIENVP